MDTQTTAAPMVHVFEKAGLGVAPFKFIGIERRVGPIRYAGENGTTIEVGAPGQPMGVCDYCGQGIAECCIIRDSAGKTFVVGNDCVAKTGDSGLRKQMAPALKEMRYQAALRKATKVRAQLETLLQSAATRDALRVLPHPYGLKERSALDWAEWMIKNAGNAGRERVLKFVRKTVEAV